MEMEQKFRTLQIYYAAALADSTLRYGKAGVLDEVTAQKRADQMQTGVALAERSGVKEPRQAFGYGDYPKAVSEIIDFTNR